METARLFRSLQEVSGKVYLNPSAATRSGPDCWRARPITVFGGGARMAERQEHNNLPSGNRRDGLGCMGSRAIRQMAPTPQTGPHGVTGDGTWRLGRGVSPEAGFGQSFNCYAGLGRTETAPTAAPAIVLLSSIEADSASGTESSARTTISPSRGTGCPRAGRPARTGVPCDAFTPQGARYAVPTLRRRAELCTPWDALPARRRVTGSAPAGCASAGRAQQREPRSSPVRPRGRPWSAALRFPATQRL